MPGVQTLLPVMLDHVAHGRLSLARLVQLVCSAPAQLYGMDGRGAIAPGMLACFSLVDLGARRMITHRSIASRCGWTPFDGMTVTGWPIATIVRGRIVMHDGQLLGDPAGALVTFVDCD